MSNKKVFLVGPGFIGMNVLDLLLAESYTVSALVRRESHADEIRALGATPVLGTLSSAALITHHTSLADIVIHTATADDLPSVQAVLAGLEIRAKSNQHTIYIHTSGTSVLDDDAMGTHKSERIYTDTDRASIEALAPTAPHRAIDLAITTAQPTLAPTTKLAIMTPPLIYGYVPAHPSRLTIQIPTLTRFALKHGYAGHIGPGLAVESNIHVLDLAAAYIVLLHHLEDSSTPASASPYFFCESTGDAEPSWRDVAVAEGLFRAGKISSAEPREIPSGEWTDLFGRDTGAVLGLNSRSRAVRLRELGWVPKAQKGWRESFLEDELPQILKEEGTEAFTGYKGTVSSGK